MSEPFLAEVRLFGFNFPPQGWAKCDGQILPINQNQSLFSLLGTTYGGDGRTTFALPELRGRACMHEGNGHQLGQKTGQENHTLNIAEIPSHTHQLQAYSEASDSNQATGRRYGQASIASYSPLSGSKTVTMNADAVGNAGANAAHDNMQPYLAVNFCIALSGVFPSRN